VLVISGDIHGERLSSFLFGEASLPGLTWTDEDVRGVPSGKTTDRSEFSAMLFWIDVRIFLFGTLLVLDAGSPLARWMLDARWSRWVGKWVPRRTNLSWVV